MYKFYRFLYTLKECVQILMIYRHNKGNMMKSLLLAIPIVALTGCGTLSKTFSNGVAGLPSVQHCQKVSYIRDNGQIKIEADCMLPAADPGGLGLAGMI